MVSLDTNLSSDDFLSKMPTPISQPCGCRMKTFHILVNETGRRQLGRKSVTKYFLETPLVVIKALLAVVIHRTDINNNVACI